MVNCWQCQGVLWAAVLPGQLGVLLSSAMTGSVFHVILCALCILHLENKVCALPTAAEKGLRHLRCLTVTKPGEGSHRLECILPNGLQVYLEDFPPAAVVHL